MSITSISNSTFIFSGGVRGIIWKGQDIFLNNNRFEVTAALSALTADLLLFSHNRVARLTGNTFTNSAGSAYPITAAAAKNIILDKSNHTSLDVTIAINILIPTAGYYVKGDFVPNWNPVVAGGGGSQYIADGWKRLTTGSAHVLNTDWVEVRTLTGT